MANNNIEIEIQVNVDNPGKLIEFLANNGEFKSEKRQLDEYFSPAHRDFLSVRPAEEWLRLRDADGKCSMNYKNWHSNADGKSNYCDEYETKIESIDQARKIFTALNFKSLVIVDKIRKTWDYNDYEIAVDSVQGLGEFIEIEYIGTDNNADPKKITNEMVNFLKSLDCGKISRNYMGYPFLLLFPDEAKYEVQ